MEVRWLSLLFLAAVARSSTTMDPTSRLQIAGSAAMDPNGGCDAQLEGAGTCVTPRLVAKMTMGARPDSSARLRYVKHSTSSMCTCGPARTSPQSPAFTPAEPCSACSSSGRGHSRQWLNRPVRRAGCAHPDERSWAVHEVRTRRTFWPSRHHARSGRSRPLPQKLLAHLVNEQHARHQLCSALVDVLVHHPAAGEDQLSSVDASS